MIKSKYKNIFIIIIKILFISLAVKMLYKYIGHKGGTMNAVDMTTIGLNSFYYIDYNMKIKIESIKIICLTIIVIMNYAFSLLKICNFYEGLKETIRIKSKNLKQYINKSINFYLKYIIFDTSITIGTIFITMKVLNIEQLYDMQVFLNLLLMFIFYIILPFLIIFIVDKFEYFIVCLLTSTIFADYFVYKLNIIHICIAYIIVFIITYFIILIIERKK